MRIDPRRRHAGRQGRAHVGVVGRQEQVGVERPQVAPRRLAAREHAALDRQPVVLRRAEHAHPRDRVVARQDHHLDARRAGIEGEQLVDQRERDAGLGGLVEALQLQLHVGAVVVGFEVPGSPPRSRTARATRSRRRAGRRGWRACGRSYEADRPPGWARCLLHEADAAAPAARLRQVARSRPGRGGRAWRCRRRSSRRGASRAAPSRSSRRARRGAARRRSARPSRGRRGCRGRGARRCGARPRGRAPAPRRRSCGSGSGRGWRGRRWRSRPRSPGWRRSAPRRTRR